MLNHKDILQELVEAVSLQDAKKLASLFTEDCYYEDVALGGSMHGRKEVKAGYDEIFYKFPDFKLEIRSRYTFKNVIFSEWVMTGTSSTGQHFSTRGATIDILRDGKIQENRDYYNPSEIIKAGV